jgi:GMP synthase-like glutamine amidotransferase
MSLLVFQHERHEPPAVLGSVLRDHGHRLRVIELFAGQPLPPDLDDVDGIVSMGGSPNVDQTHEHPWIAGEMALLKQAHERSIPIVGICLGAQLIAAALGGKVAPMATPEAGWANVKQAFPGTIDTIFGGIPWDTMQMHLHGQEVTALPPGGTPLAGSKLCKTQAFRVGMTTYGFQYHFEWNHTDIARAANDPLVARAGVTAESISQGSEGHVPGDRGLGDRLCETIALLLFPIDRLRD